MNLKMPPGWTLSYVGRVPPFNGKGYVVNIHGVPQFTISVDPARQKAGIPIEAHLKYFHSAVGGYQCGC
jgi:hypothetical protein